MSATPSTSTLSESVQIAELTRQLHWANLKIQVLEEQLRLERIKKYGPGSEKLSDAQLDLLDLEPGVSHVEVQAESEREPLPAPAKKQQQKHPGRQELPAELPRVERVIACAPEQCACKACGKPTVVIGYEESEQLDVEPAKYFVLVTKREKRVCKSCEEGGVAAAPAPARIIEKSLVSDQFAAVLRDATNNALRGHRCDAKSGMRSAARPQSAAGRVFRGVNKGDKVTGESHLFREQEVTSALTRSSRIFERNADRIRRTIWGANEKRT